MAEIKLLDTWDMEAIDARITKMGRELYQLLEDYPALQPPGWSYVDAFMFLHQQIYDEGMKLKKAALAAVQAPPSGGALKQKAS
jgi:hypothetical protein